MPKPGYNPTRRNRNIGTAKSGLGQDNRFKIPSNWADERKFYEKLVDPVVVPVTVKTLAINVLVEPPKSNCQHSCTVDDIAKLLHQIPFKHLADINLVVLRQAKRKERIMSSVWGRLVYWSEIGRFSGPAIYLESMEPNSTLKWSKSLTPEFALELDRLRQDGHDIDSSGRHHLIHLSPESIRNTQLFRSLPHEIGHYMDYLEKVKEPGGEVDNNSDELWQAYCRRPGAEREAFAHRYAGRFFNEARKAGAVPFDQIYDSKSMRAFGLDPQWFMKVED